MGGSAAMLADSGTVGGRIWGARGGADVPLTVRGTARAESRRGSAAL